MGLLYDECIVKTHLVIGSSSRYYGRRGRPIVTPAENVSASRWQQHQAYRLSFLLPSLHMLYIVHETIDWVKRLHQHFPFVTPFSALFIFQFFNTLLILFLGWRIIILLGIMILDLNSQSSLKSAYLDWD